MNQRNTVNQNMQMNHISIVNQRKKMNQSYMASTS